MLAAGQRRGGEGPASPTAATSRPASQREQQAADARRAHGEEAGSGGSRP